jgi:hypothetical protein
MRCRRPRCLSPFGNPSRRTEQIEERTFVSEGQHVQLRKPPDEHVIAEGSSRHDAVQTR